MKPSKKQQRPARPFSKQASGKRSRPVRPAQPPGAFTRRSEGEASAPAKPLASASSASARPARKPVGTFSKPFSGKSTSKPFAGKSAGKSAGRPARPAATQPVAPPAAEPERPLAAGRHQRREEEKYHGGRACEALFARRPHDIIRVYITEEKRRSASALLRFCAEHRKGFQVVEQENLQRLTGSLHHEGIAILARAYSRWDTPELMRGVAAGRLTGPVVYLDGVANPHNLGSILRVSAHFGVAALIGAEADLPPLSPAAVRVAEGGAECVPVCGLGDSVADLLALKRQGYQILTTSSRRGESIYTATLKPKVVMVLGSEGEGISGPIDALADLRIRIPGTGAVGSLNVAVAGGILLSEVWRRQPAERAQQPAGKA